MSILLPDQEIVLASSLQGFQTFDGKPFSGFGIEWHLTAECIRLNQAGR